jgi:hypothetical protein
MKLMLYLRDIFGEAQCTNVVASAASILALSTLVACTPASRDFNTAGGSGGIGMGGSGGSRGLGGTGGTGGTMVIPCPTNTHRCAVASPEGWSPPSAIVEGVPSPDCPAAYPEQLFDARDDIAGVPATCECSCGLPEITCGDVVLFYRQSCGPPYGPDVAQGPPDTCLVATPKQNACTAFFDEVAGPCPPVPKITREPPTSQTAYRACGTNQIDGVCENDLVCIPEIVPPFRLCVTRDGDHPCPPGYPERTMHHKGINDMRTCTECQCTNLTSGRCESVVQPFSDAACTAPKNPTLTTGNIWSDSGCVASFSYYTYTKPVVVEEGTCMPGTVEPMGTVEISEPVTFCCATN